MKKSRIFIGFFVLILFMGLYYGITFLKFRLTATIYQSESTSNLLLRNDWTDQNVVYINDDLSFDDQKNFDWYSNNDYYLISQGEHDRKLNKGIVSFVDTVWWMTTSLILFSLIIMIIRRYSSKKVFKLIIHDKCHERRPSFSAYFKYNSIFKKLIGSRDNYYILCSNTGTKYIEKSSYFVIVAILSLILAFIINFELANLIFKTKGNEIDGFMQVNNVIKNINNISVLIKALIIYKLLSFRYFFTKFKVIK